MIVTGEASGDLHGARLVEALRKRCPDIHFSGMGGPELAAAGVDILFDAEKISVMGIIEVVAHGREILKAQRILRSHLKTSRPDLLIVIDLPDFNLLLAKAAKKLNIPVYYYICPQIWAWRTGRVKTLRKRVDGMGVILPFEEEFYRKHGLKACYVGHPLLDSVEVREGPEQFFTRYDLDPGRKYVGLLPGSRKREITSLFPIFCRAASLLCNDYCEPLSFLVPKASTISSDDLLQAGIEEFGEQLDIHIIEEHRYEAMAACSAVLAASGTVTLELTILNVPMVVAYRLAPLTFFLGKLLVRLDSFCLVNLIAGSKIVPELLQNEVCPQRIAGELIPLLDEGGKRQQMLDGLKDVRSALGEQGASDRAAADILRLLEKRITAG